MSQASDTFELDEFDLDSDRLHEECGVFGVYDHPDAAALTALGLHALQHRGQEAAGIVSFDGGASIPSGAWASSATISPAAR
jgi:amidophosphoribosyltransferase